MRRVFVPALVALAGCGDDGSSPIDADEGGDVDAEPADAAIDAGLGAWGMPTPIVELNALGTDDDPSLTSDLLEIYFSSARPGGAGGDDIWMATRATIGDPWSAPVPVVELNTASDETTVSVAGDGLSIHFGSTREATLSDIFAATRVARADAWGTPAKVVELSADGMADFGGHVTQDGLRIVFCRAIVAIDTDILVADRAVATDAWNPPTTLGSLQTGAGECECMEPDGRTIYFGSDRDGNFDIYRATRDGGAYDTPAPIAELNTVEADGDPWVAPDQRTIVFSSARTGDADLYTATR